MKRDEILTILYGILKEVFGEAARDASENMSSSTVDGWDSFTQVELLLMVEETFKVKLSYDDVINLATVGDIASVLEKKLGG